MPLLTTIRLFLSIFMLVCIWVSIVSLVVLGSAYFAITTMRRVLLTRPIDADPLDAEPLLAADTSYGSLGSPPASPFGEYRTNPMEASFHSSSTHMEASFYSLTTHPRAQTPPSASPVLGPSALDTDLFISPHTALPSPPLTIADSIRPSDAGGDALDTRLRELAKTHNSLVLASPPRKKAASDLGQAAARSESRKVPLSRTRRASRPFSVQMLPEYDVVQSWEKITEEAEVVDVLSGARYHARPAHKRSYSLPPVSLLDDAFSEASTASDIDFPIPGALELTGVRKAFQKHGRRVSLNLRPLSLASVHPCPGLELDM